jgi:hypothetical protein
VPASFAAEQQQYLHHLSRLQQSVSTHSNRLQLSMSPTIAILGAGAADIGML